VVVTTTTETKTEETRTETKIVIRTETRTETAGVRVLRNTVVVAARNGNAMRTGVIGIGGTVDKQCCVVHDSTVWVKNDTRT
jgi:hypothetical protein